MPPYAVAVDDMDLILAAAVGFVALMEGEARALDHATGIINRRGGVGKVLETLEAVSQQHAMAKAG